MIDIDANVVTAAAIGGAMGLCWHLKKELEERSEFLSYMDQDLREAFRDADEILCLSAVPMNIRKLIVNLLVAYTDDEQAAHFVDAFKRSVIDSDEFEEFDHNNPIVVSMESLAHGDGDLVWKVHRVLVSLCFGLIFLNLADEVRIKKVQDDTVRTPASLWGAIGSVFKNQGDNDTGPSNGDFQHA